MAAIIREGRATATVAETHRAIWADTIGDVAEGGSALLAGHGGRSNWRWWPCFPDAPHGSWGTPFAYCDGVRLGFAGGRSVSVECHRAPRSPVRPD
ncbi:hypothetical protein [Streptosporangium sp. NPDC004631]